MKKMLIAAFDIKAIVRFQIIPQGQTANRAYYVEKLKRLHEAVSRKEPQIWPYVFILHHDSTPAHKVPTAKQFLAQKSFTGLENPLYSPDLASYDFWLFPKVKSALKGRRFKDTEDIQKI
jgi:hypothetical protein